MSCCSLAALLIDSKDVTLLRKGVGLKTALIFVVLCCMTGCASTSQNPQAADSEVKNPDPFESFNRYTFAFNDALDRWMLKPVAKGYRFVTPDFMEHGVSNFFSNLSEVPNIVNDILQWKWAKASKGTGRFLVNSTLGFGGLIDVAQHAGVSASDGESFGQTFSHWGLPDGPYIVLPFLGPATVTDLAGLPFDWSVNPITYVPDTATRYGLISLGLLNTRANLLDAENLVSGDRYVFIRDVYLQRRGYLVSDGEGDLESLEADFEGFDEDF